MDVTSSAKLSDADHINETIERYSFLLSDASSPYLSNFLSLLDYRDGRDFMTMQEYYEKYGHLSASSPEYEKQSHPLREYMRQSEKLIQMCE